MSGGSEKGAASAAATPAGDDALTLSLADLLPDQDGEIVIDGDAGAVRIAVEETVTEQGPAAEHVTAAGVDVTGYNTYVLESGVTIYSPLDLLFDQGDGQGG